MLAGVCVHLCIFKAAVEVILLLFAMCMQTASCLLRLPLCVSMSVRRSDSSLSVFISSSCSLSICLFLQEEKGISCGLVDLDFLKCSVGFPFMRAQTKVAQKRWN